MILVCPLFIRTTPGAELVENPVPVILVMLTVEELYPLAGEMLVMVGAVITAVKVWETVLVALSVTVTVCELS